MHTSLKEYAETAPPDVVKAITKAVENNLHHLFILQRTEAIKDGFSVQIDKQTGRMFKVEFLLDVYNSMCDKYNLPPASTFPYDEYIVQLPYVFDNDTTFHRKGGRPDLTKTFVKEHGKWIPVN